MSTGICPNCGTPYPPGQFSCPNCRNHSFDDGNPYASPSLGPDGPMPVAHNLREVASKQRLLVLAVGIMLILQAINIGLNFMPRVNDSSDSMLASVSLAISILYLGVVIFSIVALLMLAATLHYGLASRILLAVLMFCPCVNIITMLVINGQATKILTRGGITVGFFGANMRQFDQGGRF